ncbi:MAG TPA: hypothetical protein DCR20_08555, partial [Planctomycetaceae bacterium]|nr:hypothetical protein [Planctomycetaceae bacterium]
ERRRFRLRRIEHRRELRQRLEDFGFVRSQRVRVARHREVDVRVFGMHVASQ